MKLPIKEYVKLLSSYLASHWNKIVLLFLLVISSAVLQMINPLILKSFIDIATSGGVSLLLVKTALLFIGIAIISQIISVVATYVGDNIGWITTNSLRKDLAKHCLSLDLSFHLKRTPGTMIERLDGDITTLANFFSQFIVRMLSNMLMIIGVLVVLYVEDWRIGITFTAFTFIAFFILNRMRNVAIPHWMKSREASANMFSFIEERLSGIADVKANGAIDYVMNKLFELNRLRLKTDRKTFLVGAFPWFSTKILFAFGMGVALSIGTILFIRKEISLGTVYLVYAYIQMLRMPIEQITQQMQDLQRASASIERVQELVSTENKIIDGKGYHLSEGPLSVEFNHVSFFYDEREVLKDITFSLQPGKVLGLLGRTGSGKSTLIKLIFRFYDANDGSIRLGNVDTKDLTIQDLRRSIALVTQDVQLFSGTVRDNITFFNDNIDDEQIIVAIKELGLWNWFKKLPEGLQTQLGPNGTGMSAGEAQLLSLTRIYLKDPSLIIFDEASSRLDPATEKLLMRAMDKLLFNRTGIIIAHRLTTVEKADEILILDKGCIVERGYKDKLESDPSSYFSDLKKTGMGELTA